MRRQRDQWRRGGNGEWGNGEYLARQQQVADNKQRVCLWFLDSMSKHKRSGADKTKITAYMHTNKYICTHRAPHEGSSDRA